MRRENVERGASVASKRPAEHNSALAACLVLSELFLSWMARVCYIYSIVKTATRRNQGHTVEFKRCFAGSETIILCDILNCRLFIWPAER